MKRARFIPVIWLLAGNALAVLLLIGMGNWWWWERLSHLDADAKTAVATSSESRTSLLELMQRQLPLRQRLSQSALYTSQFIDELELLVLDASRDYRRLKTLEAKIEELNGQIEAIWPATMSPQLLRDYQINMGIVLDIIYEVVETTSPNQLQLLAEESEESLNELLKVMERIEQQSQQLLEAAERQALEISAKSEEDVSHLDEVLTQIRQQSMYFILFGSLLILALQWQLFRSLKQRLAGLGRVMREIADSGSIDKQVENTREGDLIGAIGLTFNRMLERLQSTRQALQEEKLRAESATRAKSDFLANMSHEIRTPVHAITSLIHLMKEQRMPPQLERYASKVEVASEALLHVINDVLDFSKVVEGKLELDSERFSLPSSLEKLVDVFSSKFNEKGLDLVLYLAPDVPANLQGDRLRLNQILINLINNAFKFTHQGAVSLHIACCERADATATLRFEIKDTGIGIEPERIDNLFDAFAQADASTTRKYGGTGLGLAISKRLSALMGGDIQVISEPGRGSTFTLTATFGVAEQNAAPFIPPLPEAMHQQAALLICAPGAQQAMLEQTLRAWQLQPTTAATIDSALASGLATSAYRLLIIDVPQSAERSLESYLDTLSRHAELWSLPVIFLSHRGLKEEAARVVRVVDRPVKPSELFNALCAALDLPHLQVESQKTVRERRKERQRLQAQIAGARILVVEDVAINQQIAKEILNKSGFHVSVADNGREALELLETEAFDLVLMDLQMPVMGGLEATRAIRARAELAGLPIVAMTANVIKGVVEECLEAGCNDYLSKPLDMDQLWRVLNQWIPAAERTPYVTDMTPPEPAHGGSTALPDQLPGVEVASALARVGGNLALYLDLLDDFVRQYADVVGQLQPLIQGQDYPAARRLAHSLKGVASNLGIVEVSLAAQSIEHQAQALSEQPDADPAALQGLSESAEDLHHHLARALLSIEKLTAAPAPVEAEPAPAAAANARVDYAAVKSQLVQLASLIDASDADALERFEQLKPRLISSELSALAEQLESHLNCFSFDDAREALATLLQHLDVKESEPHG